VTVELVKQQLFFKMVRLAEYQVIGRKLPTEHDKEPKMYRMLIFAPNALVAKSRYWYFLRKSSKVKKASGEIVSVNKVKRYQSVYAHVDF
jgi:large subunit ribosomal protein L18Ae